VANSHVVGRIPWGWITKFWRCLWPI